MSACNNILQLPPELWGHLLCFLDISEKMKLREVCQRTREVVDTHIEYVVSKEDKKFTARQIIIHLTPVCKGHFHEQKKSFLGRVFGKLSLSDMLRGEALPILKVDAMRQAILEDGDLERAIILHRGEESSFSALLATIKFIYSPSGCLLKQVIRKLVLFDCKYSEKTGVSEPFFFLAAAICKGRKKAFRKLKALPDFTPLIVRGFPKTSKTALAARAEQLSTVLDNDKRNDIKEFLFSGQRATFAKLLAYQVEKVFFRALSQRLILLRMIT